MDLCYCERPNYYLLFDPISACLVFRAQEGKPRNETQMEVEYEEDKTSPGGATLSKCIL